MAVPALSRVRAGVSLFQPFASLLSLRSLSTAGDGGEHWSAPYRRLLGIGDSPVLYGHPPFLNGDPSSSLKPWRPPSKSELKLNFSISLPKDFPKSFFAVQGDGGMHCWFHTGVNVSGGLEVLARDCSGDLIGLVCSNMEFNTEFGLQLYALKAAGNLAKILKDRGYHDGPVVYEAAEFYLGAFCLCQKCEHGLHPQHFFVSFMPEDLEDVVKHCKTHIGNPTELLKALESRYPGLKERIRQDKINAGL